MIGRFAAVAIAPEIVILPISSTEPIKWDMVLGKKLANFTATSPALNNVESRAGIAQPQGVGNFGSTFALPATARAMSAPIETGDLL
jgi:hypothetical protein